MPFSLGFWAAAGAGGGAAGAFEQISTTTLSGTQASVTFSSIPSTYKHLRIHMTMRSDRAGAENEILFVRFNGNTGSNYASHFIRSNSDYGVTVGSYTSETYMRGEQYPATGDTANAFGVAIIDVTDYANTTNNKTQRILSGKKALSTAQDAVSLRSGLWLSTSAISSITLGNQLGSNFVSGSRFTLYGIKG